ncbi:hypothetical protein 1 [Beihai picorna-like virus 100]|uniref:hypothetical protein 1 n=1 Tax=Beihai picorna-like virus 100 TaxID=1922528 RepID=UPI00090C70E5|nr:hypothetical protein 1 [Beihai picorna-like virus 100]APG76829.1 hypothetical protein 1 [Beihai picorna-like virus 100]
MQDEVRVQFDISALLLVVLLRILPKRLLVANNQERLSSDDTTLERAELTEFNVRLPGTIVFTSVSVVIPIIGCTPWTVTDVLVKRSGVSRLDYSNLTPPNEMKMSQSYQNGQAAHVRLSAKPTLRDGSNTKEVRPDNPHQQGGVIVTPNLCSNKNLRDNLIESTIQEGYIMSGDSRIPIRMREVLKPNIKLDFEAIDKILDVCNRTYCKKCTTVRHAKIINWVANNNIDESLFNPKKLLSHIDEFCYEILMGKSRLNRKMRRYYKYLPRSQRNLESLLKSSIRNDKLKKKNRQISRGEARDIKYMAQLFGFTPTIKHDIHMSPELEKNIAMVNSALNDINQTIGNSTNFIKDGLDNISENLNSHIIGLITMFAALYKARDVTDIILALSSYFSRFIKLINITYPYFESAINQVASWVRSKFEEESYYEAQININPLLEFCWIVNDAILSIVGIPSTLFKVLRPNASLIRDISQIITGVEKLSSFFIKYISLVIDSITKYFNPQPGTCEYLDYIDEVRAFLDPDVIQNMKKEDMPAVVRKTTELYNRGMNLNMRIKKEHDQAKVNAFVRTFTLVGSLLKSISPYFFADKLRISPYIICLRGDSGVGKSHLNQMLPTALYSHPAVNVPIAGVKTKYTPGEDVYVRNFSQKYWDGYRNQRVVIFDDYLQMRETESISESLNELIRVSNNNPYPLNMADVTEKGCVRFTSDLVMITTNADLSDNELRNFVQNPTAIKRRIHKTVQVSLKPEYMDPVTRVYKGPKEFQPNAWIFTVEGAQYNLIELLDYLAPRFIDHREKDHKMINANDDECDYENLKKFFQAQSYPPSVEEIEASMKYYEDDIPEFENFYDDVTALMDHEYYECQIMYSESLGSHIKKIYAAGNPLGILGFDYNDYLADGCGKPGSKAHKRMRQLLLATHPDKMNNDQLVSQIVIWVSLLIKQPEIVEAIYAGRFFGLSPFGGYDRKQFELPKFEIPTQPGFRYFPLPRTHRNIKVPDICFMKDIDFDEALDQSGDDIDLEDEEFDMSEPESQRQQKFDWSNWRKYFSQDGIDIAWFWADYFGTQYFTTENPHSDHGYRYRSTNHHTFFGRLKATLAYASSILLTSLGVDASPYAKLNIIKPIRKIAKVIKVTFLSASPRTFVDYIKNDFIKDIKTVIRGCYDNMYDLCLAYFEGLLAGAASLDQQSTYKIFQSYLTSLLPYGLYAMSILGIIRIATKIIYLIKDSIIKPKNECVSEGYCQKDAVQTTPRIISESYSQRDAVRSGPCIVSESYAKKDTVQSAPKIVSESYVKRDTVQSAPKIVTESYMGEGKLSLDDIAQMKHFRAEISADPMAVDLMTGKIRNNMVRISIDSSNPFVLNGIFIGGRILITTHHLIKTLETVGKRCVTITGKTTKITNFDIIQNVIYTDVSKDIVFVNVPEASNYVDIIRHFFIDDEVNCSLLSSVEGTIVSYANNIDTLFLKLVRNIKAHGPVKYTLGGSAVYQLNNSWHYYSDTAAGDCGGPLVLHNKAVAHKILGIHVAGLESAGVSTPITQNYINRVLHETGFRVPRIEVPILAAQANGMVSYNDKTQYFGEVPSQYQYRIPTETKLKKSPFYGVFESCKKPAYLRPFKTPNGIINPVRMQIEKQFVDNIVIDEDIKEAAYQDLNNLLLSYRSPYKDMKNKVLNEDHTLNGVIGDDNIPPMNMKTSAGYPWIFYTKKSGKKDFVEGEPGSYSLTSEVRDYLNLVEKELSEGIIRPFIWGDCLKDEKRPIDKVDAGKTRVFNVGPFELTYLTRKFFGTFVAHLTKNRLGEISIGVNPHSTEWSAIRQELEKFKFDKDGNERESYVMCGDYSNYDKRLPYCLIELALKIINNWYGDDPYGSAVRESIFIATFNALHLCGRSLYRCGMGNPSGCGITAQINSLVNSLIARVVFGIVGSKQEVPVPMSKFTEYVVYKSYGDDNLASVSCMADWFNMKSFAEVCSSFGISYTTATKGEVDQDYISWDDASYLKRKFVKESNTWCWAPLEMESITEMMMWIKNSEMSMEDIMKSTFNSFTNELGHYDKETYNRMIAKIQERAYTLDIHLPSDTFEVTQMRIKTGQVFE